MYFVQRPIFEHSVSGVGNLPSHECKLVYQEYKTAYLRLKPISTFNSGKNILINFDGQILIH